MRRLLVRYVLPVVIVFLLLGALSVAGLTMAGWQILLILGVAVVATVVLNRRRDRVARAAP